MRLRLLAIVTVAAAHLLVPAASAAATVQTVQRGTVHDTLFAVAFDGANGIAAGGSGVIRETADGGRTWTVVTPAPSKLALLGVAISGPHALAVGQQGLILRRVDGRWAAVDAGISERLLAVSVNAAGAAVAVGAFGTVITSSDGGASWADARPDWASIADGGNEPHLYASAIDADGRITVSGEFALILRRAAGSTPWTVQHKGEASLFALSLLPGRSGYAVGQGGTVLRSDDGGSSWQPVEVGTGSPLLGVDATADGRVLVSGLRELRLSADDGKTWTPLSGEGIASHWQQGVARSVDADGGTQALITVGQAGRILRVD